MSAEETTTAAIETDPSEGIHKRQAEPDQLNVVDNDDAQGQKEDSAIDSSQNEFNAALNLKKIKSVEELKIDFDENEKILSSLSFNINDLFKKINSLAEEVSNEVDASPVRTVGSLKQIQVPVSNSPRWKSEHLIQEIQKEKQVYNKLNEEIMRIPQVQEIGISMRMFEVGRVLGHGKFGEVLHCRDRKTGLLYGLKKVFKSTIDQYQMHDQILTEIEACKRMNHPNIIKTYCAFTDEFHIFILTELAEGEKLVKKFNSSQGYISRIIRQVLDAIQYIHKSQVAHRDLKPQNIIVSEYGTIKICDFGWSGLIDRQQDMNIICGTLDYVCPEMVLKEVYSQEVDLWSVGVLVYELLYGQAPFKAETRQETFAKVQNIQYGFPEKKQISEECRDFISKLLKPEGLRMRLDQCLQHPFITKYPAWEPSNAFQFDTLFD